MSYFARSDELPKWAAQVPDGWGSNWLKWSVDLSTKRPTEEEQKALPYIANEDIASWTGKLLIEEPKPSEANSRTFQKNDVLFNKLRPYLAKVYHATFDGASSGELLCLRPHAAEPRFLFYVLVSKGFIDTINAETFGAKMPRADWEIVGHQSLPLPSLDTQRRILRFLDEKTAQIDGLIEKKRALLGRLAEKRLALITRAVTQGLNAQAPTKPSGIDWLGDIPAHWEVKRLRFLLTGGTLNGLYKRKEAFDPEGIPFVQMGEAFRSPVFDGGTEDCVHASNDEIEKWGLMNGDFLIARRSIVFEGSGKSVLVSGLRGPHLFESSMIRIRLQNPQHHSKYLSFYFQSHIGRASVLSVTKRVTISGIDSQQLKSIHIPVPPDSEARDIAATCETCDRVAQHVEREISASIKRLAEYRDALVTAAVTGQLPELR